ncbi:MAG: glycosyltransferase family 9 protein [Melioribacteraceae bacterium]|nr:glycosyltransferase family 9 protein [Melioribacteraceae bacterium]
MKKSKNILIIRTDRIGDVVLTLPMAEILKKKYRDSKITFLLREYTEPLARNNKFIDQIITLKSDPRELSFSEINEIFKNQNFNMVFVVSPEPKLALAAFINRVNVRIGSGYRWYSFLFNRKIYEHRKYGRKHELEHNIEMLKSIGINHQITTKNVHFNIHSDIKSGQIVQNWLKSKNLGNGLKTVIVHPGSGGSAVDLPINSMKELVFKLASELNINLIISGSKAEIDLCNDVKGKSNAIVVAGEFNLEEFIALIANSDMLIANSTGPIHIAAALGKWVVGFYPKVASCSETRWGPYSKKKIIFEPETDCRNCTVKQCAETKCMNSININKVFEQIKSIIEKKK